jgi:hypothetical protein
VNASRVSFGMLLIHLPMREQKFDKVRNQYGNIFLPFAQGRQHDRKHIEPLTEVTTELIPCDQFAEIAMRRGD